MFKIKRIPNLFECFIFSLFFVFSLYIFSILILYNLEREQKKKNTEFFDIKSEVNTEKINTTDNHIKYDNKIIIDNIIEEIKNHWKLSGTGNKMKDSDLIIFSQFLVENFNKDRISLALSYAKTESNYNPKAIGGVGELGMFQFRPCTAEEIARKIGIDFNKNFLKDSVYCLQIWMEYITFIESRVDNDLVFTALFYNTGPFRLANKHIFENNKDKSFLEKNYSIKEYYGVNYNYHEKIHNNYNNLKKSLFS